ncbi:MAG: AmmeMemoRadiSam system protein B [Thaumarchaeota archaeon]|nr:AmmeMemoRadiSam system protein B [Nitrososphaerota archaeon]
MIVRRPAVAGSFYPEETGELRRAIRSSYTNPLGPGLLPPSREERRGVLACVCPHAGYVYSGPVAAHSYLWLSSLRRPELVVIVGPNHYGVGSGISTFREGDWATPLGNLPVDAQAARKIVELTGLVDYDPESHRREHSIEVQLPFLQDVYHEFKILPISLAFQDIETARELGRGLSTLLKGRDAILIASSDLTHYEPAPAAREKDMALLDTVRRLDTASFYSILEERRITACGYGAIATVMEASRLLGSKAGGLHKYASSGDTTGDNDAVVGYPSVSFG